tara:strand:- start:807 stop:1922 length:1116 start_codon:yes stop_codon:yes gene_type:complete
MKNTNILVKAKSGSYPIYFGNKIIKSTGSLIKKNIKNTKKVTIICDRNVPSNFLIRLKKSLKKYQLKIYFLNANEKTKSFKVANRMVENLLKDNLNRSDCVIAFGGGIIGDLSAFVASLTKRGVKFINIPSTLLAQVDSSIGGKTGINSNKGKNLIGTFYQPSFVIVDTSILNTLPYREMVCGYAEILKHSLILDKKFFIWLTKNAKKIIEKRDKKLLNLAIIKSCKIKSSVIAKDEREKDIRKILNFGHTFAHGFEGAANFSKKMNHGEAVLLGMMTAIEFAYKKKIFNFKDYIMIKKHYLDLNLPMNIKKKFTSNKIDKIISFMKKDKKNFNEKINLILLKKIGKTIKPNKIHVNDWVIKKFLKSIYNK